MDNFYLEIPSNPENIRLVENMIEKAKQSTNLTDDLYGNIMVAATESVTNAIYHGNKEDKEKNVAIELHIDNTFLSLCVKDEGKGFDNESVVDPTLPENLEKAGGRGIYLMKHLCDKITFADNGASVTMEFKLN